MSFKANACDDYILGHHNTDDNNGNPIRTYFIDNKPATEKAYNAFVKEQDENNTIYNVEMQRGKHKSLPKRLRYYQGSIDLDLISKGEDYKKLIKSYVIFICTFDLFDKGRHKYTFQNVCIEDNSIMLNDETQKIIFNTKGFMNDLNEELLEFLQYVDSSTDEVVKSSKGKLVRNIHKRVQEVKNDISVEVEFMTLLERDREKIE